MADLFQEPTELPQEPSGSSSALSPAAPAPPAHNVLPQPPPSMHPSRPRPIQPVPATVLNFFPAFAPPKSGGEMRYWHLYDRLSRLGFDLQLVNPTHPFVEPETIDHNPRMREFRIPKTMVHHRLHQTMLRLLRLGECSAPVVALATAWHHPEFIRQARECIARSRMVIFDYPLPIDPFLSMNSPNRPFLVYNSYNVEKILLQRTMAGPQSRMIAALIGRYERKLCRHADVIFACSHEDADSFVRLYDVDPTKIYIIPNGVDTEGIQPVRLDDAEATKAARRQLQLDLDQPVALFLGSQHPPNIEAAEFIIRKIAPKLPQVQFLIAGSVCGGIADSIPLNVRLQGKFEDDLKPHLLQSATVAINPLFSGSGTNLKMLEFFAAGLPVVATPFGARGLLARDGEHLCLVDKNQFAERLGSVLLNPTLRRTLARQSRALACERFNWDRIAEDAAEILHHKTYRRILVLNDFPITPVTFGGKVRVFHLYRPVARECNVTILTQTDEPQHARRVLAPGVEELNIPISASQRLLRKILPRLIGVAADDLAACLTVRRTKAIRQAYLRERRHAAAIILSHPFMVPLVHGDEQYPLLYDSHGVASLLKTRLYSKGFWGRWALRRIFKCERDALRRASFIAGCSEEDLENFRRAFADVEGMKEKLAVVPNGVDCGAHQPPSIEQRIALKRRAGYADGPVAVYLASGHPPNVDAARFLINEVVPLHPQIQFIFIGSVCWAVKNEATASNIHLLFEQGEDAKNRLLEMADVALNPLMAGSGTCLKVLDYMAAGSTVLATEIGARGIAIENGVSGVVCPLDEISSALKRLTSDLNACHAMGRKGAEIARKLYDWEIAAKPIIEALRQIMRR